MTATTTPPTPVEALVDPRFGVVRRIESMPVPPTLPRTFRLLAATLCDTRRWSDWPSDSAGAGCTLDAGTSAGHEAATGAAVGEAVERYCGNLVPSDLVRATARQLRRKGRDVLDLSSVALFGDDQYRSPGFAFAPLHDDLDLEWATGADVLTGRSVLVPASLVWVSYVAASPERGVPFTNPVVQAGLAAGPGLAAAQESALLEVLERDTMTLAWHGRRRLREVQAPPGLARLARGAQGTLTTRFLELPGDDGRRVLAALVHDAATGYLTLGTAARHEALPAMRKAFTEACQLQLFVGDYDDPHGGYMAAAQDPRSPLRPWRADRSYGQAYRPDLADVRDYGCHLQLYLDPVMQDRFCAALDESLDGTVRWDELDESAPPAASVDRLRALAARLSAAGHRTVAVDVTTDDVRPTGLRVVRVLVTGTYTNTAAGLPLLGGDRLRGELHGRIEDRRPIPLPH